MMSRLAALLTAVTSGPRGEAVPPHSPREGTFRVVSSCSVLGRLAGQLKMAPGGERGLRLHVHEALSPPRRGEHRLDPLCD